MNRLEFMRRLAELLEDLPAQERSDALRFYNGYFYDAGEENEQQVIESLGSPEAVAEAIRREVAEDIGRSGPENQSQRASAAGAEAGYFEKKPADGAESGEAFRKDAEQEDPRRAGNTYRAPDYRAYRQRRREEQDAYRRHTYGSDPGQRVYESYGEYDEDPEFRKPEWEDRRSGRTSNPWKVLVIIGLCILFSPVLLGAAAVLFGLLITVLALLFGLMVTVAALTFGFLIAGIAGLAVSISHIAWSPLWALLEAGVSLFSIGFGLFALWLFWVLVAKVGPGIWQGIRSLWRALVHGRARA